MYLLYMDHSPTVMAKGFGHDCIVKSQKADFHTRNQLKPVKQSKKKKL